MKKQMKGLLALFFLACLFVGIKVLNPIPTTNASGVFNNVRQTDASSEYVAINWNETQDKSLDICWTCYADKAMTTMVDHGDADLDGCTINDLNAGKTYWVKLEASKELGESPVFCGSYVFDVVTCPEVPANTSYKVTGMSKGKCTLSWSAITGADSYILKYWKKDDIPNQQTVTTTKTSTTLTLKKNTLYGAIIAPARTSSSGFTAAGWPEAERINNNKVDAALREYIYAAPENIGSISASFDVSNKQKIKLKLSKKNALSDGFEWQILDKNGKKLVSKNVTKNKNGSVTISSSKIKKNSVYQIKVRTYTINDNGTKCYSSPTTKYISRRPVSYTVSQKKNVKIKWDKIDGANRYVIYATTGKTKNVSKFKQVATVKSNKNVYTIKKINGKKLKKGKTYSIYVIPQKKVNGKYITLVDSPVIIYSQVR